MQNSNTNRIEDEKENLLYAFSSAKEGIVIVDENERLVYYNQAYASIFGYTSEELKDKSWKDLTSEDDIAVFGGLLKAALEKRGSGGGFCCVVKGLKKDGSSIDIEVKSASGLEENGRHKGFICFISDITDKTGEGKVNALNTLKNSGKNSESLLSHIINSLPEPTFVINKDHQVIIWNKAVEAITGIKAGDVLLKDNYAHAEAIFGSRRPLAADLLLEPDPFYERLYATFQRLENTLVCEIDIKIPSRTENVYIWSIASKLFDAEDNLIGAIQTIRDITGLKKIEQELRLTKDLAEEHDKLKSHFIASMSHELRTPLVGILGFSEIILSEIEDGDTKEKVKIIFESGKRLMETLNGILDFSKLESNRFEVHNGEVNISAVMEDIVDMYQTAAKGKNLCLELDIREKDIRARLDESILLQALKNILNNAVKYTSRGGIKVSVFKEFMEQESAWVSISVADSGIGISQEHQKLIFEPFRQASEGFNRKYEGTGLGLSLTKKFVEVMHGKISFYSKEGVGTTVKLSFPLNEEAAVFRNEDVLKEVDSDKTSIIEQKNVPSILFVEDDAVSQTVMKLFLKGICEVEIAPDGEIALQMVRKKQYSAVLMDMNLGGGLNGLEVTEVIREMPQYKAVPIVAVTAYAMAGEKEKILSQGCSYYISKPFTRLDLTGLIKRILGSPDSQA